MKKNLMTLCLAAAAVPALAADPAPRALQGDLVHGKELYEKHCMSCHGSNGVGKEEGVRLSDSGRLNALTDAHLLKVMREETRKSKKKKAHPILPADLELLDAWDIVGFMRNHTVEVAAVVAPDADRFIAGEFGPDENALERLKKTLGRDVKEEEAKLHVFTIYKTGWGGPMQLLSNDPKVLDTLKKNMKVAYVVSTPLPGQERPTDVVFTLDPKTFALVGARAITLDGTAQPELDMQLARFVGKGDRRVSGQPKATLKAGGGGKNFAALEAQVTEAFVKAAEAVTAYEVVERDRTWADGEF